MKNQPSIETQHEMVRFFMKSIIPRIIEQRRKEKDERLRVARDTRNVVIDELKEEQYEDFNNSKEDAK